MDGFNDLLDEIRKQGGPLMWISQAKRFLEHALSDASVSKRTPEQLKADVLQSARLKHVIDEIMSSGCRRFDASAASVNGEHSQAAAQQQQQLKREDLVNEAKLILNEMAHQFDLKYVRLLGFMLIEVFSRIYEHIYYNADILNNLEVIKHASTIFLPLHRSYMDFLLVSIVCFHKSAQLPAIAAGQDFLGLSLLSGAIRRCGAFFIRRSFGSDKLYWAIFEQYVQEHLHNCDRPLEFFIEVNFSSISFLLCN
jgi:glyceronephosphate O-acyltransferase